MNWTKWSSIAEVTSGVLGMLNDAPVFDELVAEEEGTISGSIFASIISNILLSS